MNIGAIVALLLVGSVSVSRGVVLGWFYVATGTVTILATFAILKAGISFDTELLDSAFFLVFVLFFTALLFRPERERPAF